MKKIVVISLLISLFFGVKAQSNIPIKLEKGLLWEISGNGLKQSSYLFGTMHLMPQSDFFYPSKTIEKLKNAKTLALEIDINIPIKEQIKLAQEILLPDGKTVKDFLSKEDYSRFKTYLLDTLDLSEKKYNKYVRFKPFFIYSILLTEELGKVKSYEKEFNKLAKKKGLKIVGLEEIAYQMKIVNQIDIEEQALSMIGADIEKEFNEMLEVYMKEDLNELFLLMFETPDYKSIEEQMLIQRNLNWIPHIEEQITKASTFIAVGAAHLAGSKGVIVLLREKGYTLKAVH